MKLTGEQHIPAPRKDVWSALNDPAVLAACIPGCQSLEREADDRFAAVAEVRIGPIGARFKGSVQLSEIDAPNGYTISGSGNGGIAGNAKGGAKVRLTDAADGGTLLTYQVDAEVGGRMAQLGGPIIDATAKGLAGKFFEKFCEVVAGGLPSPAAATAIRTAPLAVGKATNGAASSPWPWLALLGVAIVAGYLLGVSGADYGWVVGIVALALVAFFAGRSTGSSSGA